MSLLKNPVTTRTQAAVAPSDYYPSPVQKQQNLAAKHLKISKGCDAMADNIGHGVL